MTWHGYRAAPHRREERLRSSPRSHSRRRLTSPPLYVRHHQRRTPWRNRFQLLGFPRFCSQRSPAKVARRESCFVWSAGASGRSFFDCIRLKQSAPPVPSSLHSHGTALQCRQAHAFRIYGEVYDGIVPAQDHSKSLPGLPPCQFAHNNDVSGNHGTSPHA